MTSLDNTGNFQVPYGMTLKGLRERAKLTKREVARRMGQTHQNVMRLEEEGTAPITTLEAYAEAIKVDFHDVFDASLETRRLKGSGTLTPV